MLTFLHHHHHYAAYENDHGDVGRGECATGWGVEVKYFHTSSEKQGDLLRNGWKGDKIAQKHTMLVKPADYENDYGDNGRGELASGFEGQARHRGLSKEDWGAILRGVLILAENSLFPPKSLKIQNHSPTSTSTWKISKLQPR